MGQTDGPDAGLARLDAIGGDVVRLQAYHATRAELLARAGRVEAAADAFGVAIQLTTDDDVRQHLERRRWRLART